MEEKDGTFYSTQKDRPPNLPKGMSAEKYWSLDDAGRRAIGLPPIDHGVYTDQNGAMIEAYVRFWEATRDASALDVAKKAAEALLADRQTPDGYMINTKRANAVSADQRIRAAAFDLGADVVLQKPVPFDGLLNEIARLLTEPIEQRPHGENLDAVAEKLADRRHDRRRGVLSLRSHRGRNQAKQEAQAGHRQPPCISSERSTRPSHQRPRAISAMSQNDCTPRSPSAAAPSYAPK